MTPDASLPRHPLGVKPLDELLVEILEYLDAKSLARLGATCKSLFAFSRLDDLWKSFYVDWQGSWYASYIGRPKAELAKVQCEHLFSDVLYRPFQCAHIDLHQFTTTIPQSRQIPRLTDLSTTKFQSEWTQRPFILTGSVTQWPVFQHWSTEALLAKHGDTAFRAEAVDWPLRTYADYMDDNADESPLYLFDRGFAEKMDLTVGHGGDYWPPSCFGDDLFAVLGSQRPDCRWLIVGPARGGSTFHKDPNATSAWNAVIRGAKYWIMFPGYVQPPGVFVSANQGEVTSPLSIAEWLLEFHAEARKHPACLEGICREGEVLHVPSGWWHLVVNLTASIAITQNFVPESHLVQALSFLKSKPEQVSGFQEDVKDPYGLFVTRLKERHPNLLAEALEDLSRSQNGKKRKWDELVEHKVTSSTETIGEAGAFSFGFEESDQSDS